MKSSLFFLSLCVVQQISICVFYRTTMGFWIQRTRLCGGAVLKTLVKRIRRYWNIERMKILVFFPSFFIYTYLPKSRKKKILYHTNIWNSFIVENKFVNGEKNGSQLRIAITPQSNRKKRKKYLSTCFYLFHSFRVTVRGSRYVFKRCATRSRHICARPISTTINKTNSKIYE